MATFGKRQPGPAPAVKRSQSVPLRMMAGAGAAALGVYAIWPNSACPQGRLYDTADQCIADGRLAADICRDGFAKAAPGSAGVLFGGGRGAAFQPLMRTSYGTLTFEDGVTPVPLGEVCRRGTSSGWVSRGTSSGWSRSSFFSSSSSGQSSAVSSTGHDSGGLGAVSRGGFGSTGHAYSGGGG